LIASRDNSISEETVSFKRVPCLDCHGSGELRIDSKNINELFEVERQTVITECPACYGFGFKCFGFKPPGTP